MKKGFTLAEVLITLTIIGIVSAISIPSLTSAVQEKAFNAQRKALHARLAAAVSQMTTVVVPDSPTLEYDNISETFIVEKLNKVYKIKSVCSSSNLAACGIPEKVTPFNDGSSFDLPNTFAGLSRTHLSSAPGSHYRNGNSLSAAFKTANGESVAVYANPFCSSPSNAGEFSDNDACINFVYDVNGSEGPNKIGKDVGFITVFNSRESDVVAPVLLSATPSSDSATYDNAIAICESAGGRLPDRNEAAALYLNSKLLFGESDDGRGSFRSSTFWTGSVDTMTTAYVQNFYSGQNSYNTSRDRDTASRTSTNSVYCVENN